ncbi:MAG: S24/S26 family peptidase, partial [Candidatus Acidiferrales bacterium]
MIEATEMADSKRFAAICEAALGAGVRVRFRARGQSMQPNVLDGDVVEIEPATEETLQRGDIALTRGGDRLLLHRATGREAASRAVVTRGDACMANDAPADAVFGKVISVERSGRKTSSVAPGTKVIHSARKHARRLARAVVLRADRLRALFLPLLFLAFGMLLHAPAAHAQFTITDSANPTTVAPGGTVTYTQVLTCNGGGFFGCYTPSRANPATTSQTIDANTTYVSYAVTGTARTHWTCGLTGSTLACSDTSGGTRYNNGNTTTFTVTVTVGANTPDGTVINNTVTANPGNSSASANVTVQVPDLSMTQTETPNPVATGASITYTETVSNLSGVTASGATLTQNT